VIGFNVVYNWSRFYPGFTEVPCRR